jgi:hypothetical protein
VEFDDIHKYTPSQGCKTIGRQSLEDGSHSIHEDLNGLGIRDEQLAQLVSLIRDEIEQHHCQSSVGSD